MVQILRRMGIKYCCLVENVYRSFGVNYVSIFVIFHGVSPTVLTSLPVFPPPSALVNRALKATLSHVDRRGIQSLQEFSIYDFQTHLTESCMYLLSPFAYPGMSEAEVLFGVPLAGKPYFHLSDIHCKYRPPSSSQIWQVIHSGLCCTGGNLTRI